MGIAVIDVPGTTGNQLQTIIRSVEKEIARDLKEIRIDGLISKGSRFRKSVYGYPTTNAKAFESISNSIIVEVIFFANPYPYLKTKIQSIIGEYMEKNNQTDLVRKMGWTHLA